MRIIDSEKLDFSDVLLVPHRSSLTSRKEVDITREFHFKHAYGTWSGIPIVSSNMSSVTNWETASTMHQRGMLACMPKNLSLVSVNRNYINTFGMEGLSTFRESLFPRIICLDVANGYMERFADLVKRTREEAKFSIIIAGNVVTPEMTQELILSGADIVKVGIGSGSACATRSVAGVGFPQFSAVVECADAAHGLGGHIMSDGGCTTPGDVAKAFCAGADFVMLEECLLDTMKTVPNFTENPQREQIFQILVGSKIIGLLRVLSWFFPKEEDLTEPYKQLKVALEAVVPISVQRSLKTSPSVQRS